MLDTTVRYKNNYYKHVLKTKADYAKEGKGRDDDIAQNRAF